MLFEWRNFKAVSTWSDYTIAMKICHKLHHLVSINNNNNNISLYNANLEGNELCDSLRKPTLGLLAAQDHFQHVIFHFFHDNKHLHKKASAAH
jgi:hypothetical protein